MSRTVTIIEFNNRNDAILVEGLTFEAVADHASHKTNDGGRPQIAGPCYVLGNDGSTIDRNVSARVPHAASVEHGHQRILLAAALKAQCLVCHAPYTLYDPIGTISKF